MKFCKKLGKKMEFYFRSNSVMFEMLYVKITEPLNYSQSIKIKIGPSDSGTIIPSTHRPTVLY